MSQIRETFKHHRCRREASQRNKENNNARLEKFWKNGAETSTTASRQRAFHRIFPEINTEPVKSSGILNVGTRKTNIKQRDRPRKTSEQPCRTFSFDKTLKGIPLGAPCFSLGKAELARLASKNIISRRVEEREREGKEEGRGGEGEKKKKMR